MSDMRRKGCGLVRALQAAPATSVQFCLDENGGHRAVDAGMGGEL
ncbi:MAG TPA: hypothetical protein VF593_05665 [Chthoniobacteraceae bacterium]